MELKNKTNNQKVEKKLQLFMTRKYVVLMIDLFETAFAKENYEDFYLLNTFIREIYVDNEFYYGPECYDYGENIYTLYENNKTKNIFQEIFSRIYKSGEILIKQTKKIKKTNYENKTLIELLSDFKKFTEIYRKFVMALVGFFLEHPIETRLRKILKNRENIDEDLAILTSPIKYNLPILEQRNLLKIASKINLDKKFENLNEKEMLLLSNHVDEFGWINARGGSGNTWTEKDIFQRLTLLKNSFQDKLNSVEQNEKEKLFACKNLLKELNVDKKLKDLVDVAKELVYFRTYRTDYLNKAIIDIKNLLTEMGKRRNLTTEEILCLRADEIINQVEVNNEEINRRKQNFFCGTIKSDEVIFTSDESLIKELKAKYCETLENKFDNIHGTIANKGFAKGPVKIVKTNIDLKNVNKGDILVSSMTTPNMVTAMERAAGFITDEGGITCHAAIVAREMNKPCIIGTKIASKVLKNEDIVELDAETGIIKKVKN